MADRLGHHRLLISKANRLASESNQTGDWLWWDCGIRACSLPDQRTESPIDQVATTADPNKMPPPDEVYDLLDKQLASWLDERMAGDIQLKLAWAIRSRSISEAFRLHEANYRAVFGSQIQALKSLNTIGRGAVHDLEAYYSAAAANPTWSLFYKDRTYEMWGNFLVNTGYVHLIPDTDPQEVEITPFGRQFLVWMSQSGLSEGKPA